MNIRKSVLVMLFSAFALVSCSDDEIIGSGEDVTSLRLPRSINFGGPNLDFGSDQNLLSNLALDSAGTDYTTDSVEHYWTAEQSVTLQTANNILCIVDELGAYEMLNQGAYKISSKGGFCGSEPVANAVDIFIESKRADNDSPQFVRIWVMDDVPVVFELTIEQGVNNNNPFGVFQALYQVYQADPTSGVYSAFADADIRVMRSVQNKPRYESRMESRLQGMTLNVATAAIINDISSNSGQSREYWLGNDAGNILDSETLFDFNHDNTMVSVISASGLNLDNAGCYSRNDLVDQVQRYSLYFNQSMNFNGQAVSTGQRVQLNNNLNSLQFLYTHSSINDRPSSAPDAILVDNQQYTLNYDLLDPWPILRISQPVDAPIYFNLKDGTLLNNDLGEFAIKAREISHSTLAVNADQCMGLDADAVINNADIDPRNVPAIALPSIGLEDLPQI